MSTITRERAQEIFLGNGPEPTASEERELARMALASLTAEPVYQACKEAGVWVDIDAQDADSLRFNGEQIRKVYSAPPAPVVSDELLSAMEEVLRISDRDHDAWHKAKAGIVSCRAAMLQGAGRPQNQPQNIPENIPAGWTGNGGADAALVMLDRIDTLDSDDDARIEDIKRIIRKLAGSPAEPARQHYKLPDDFEFDRFNDVVWLETVASNPHMHSPTTSTIAMVALELNRKLAAGNSPAIPDGWVACSDRMPAKGQEVLCTDQFENYETALYDTGYIPGPPFFATAAGEFHPTHWMPLPAAPQQEAK